MRFTCVHQGYELYGSDRSFVETVRVIRAAWPQAVIDVVLPRHGPIVAALEPLATRILVEPLWILRRRDLPGLLTVGLLRLPLALGRALVRIARSDLVYVNTTVVADYLLAARLFRRRCVVHVHEIPEGVVRRVLRMLLGWSGCARIYNSQATRRAFAGEAAAGRVVYNGIADPGSPKGTTYRGDRPLRLLMLGRISRIKGQDVLVEAVARLPDDLRGRIAVRIVGSAFEDAERERALAARVAEPDLRDCVTLLPFAPDPSEHFRWADLVAVPSCLPESLGRVAIEAMAHGIPPVVSEIGGLPEVVADGRTGWLVPPGDAAALSRRLADLVRRPEDWAGFPEAARARYLAVFAERASAEGMIACFRSVLERRAGRLPAEPRTE
ncbi:glycosyltransferase family 4 protein [Methylobacterium nonmethylotrophicum]|uniref:Glycosyltransferase n=1 Tax=Methylobacterium nonmethylotrophicum TaxID=1141884 RepID=A0A4Z0NRH5_9HYPH|nr:glycosyltransferase family 4 protein [Methylobacterium nonmethylotrophicum]TGD99411.1 glycosyltransferase [Methylobacterium nonmethylotrophicum]